MAEPLYHEIEQWLYREAELLDTGRLSEWLELLTDDVTYTMPVRVNRERGQSGIAMDLQHFADDRQTLQLRVDRLNTEFAWAEDPPSRTRHFVTNVRVYPTANADEVEVRSYLLLYRNRREWTGADLLSGERQDLLRRVDGAWRLARRLIVVDQSTLGMMNLSVLL